MSASAKLLLAKLAAAVPEGASSSSAKPSNSKEKKEKNDSHIVWAMAEGARSGAACSSGSAIVTGAGGEGLPCDCDGQMDASWFLGKRAGETQSLGEDVGTRAKFSKEVKPVAVAKGKEAQSKETKGAKTDSKTGEAKEEGLSFHILWGAVEQVQQTSSSPSSSEAACYTEGDGGGLLTQLDGEQSPYALQQPIIGVTKCHMCRLELEPKGRRFKCQKCINHIICSNCHMLRGVVWPGGGHVFKEATPGHHVVLGEEMKVFMDFAIAYAPDAADRAGDPQPPDTPIPDMDKLPLPSLGSIGHDFGTCQPCHYAHSRVGCRRGKRCGLCHFKHPKRRKRPTEKEGPKEELPKGPPPGPPGPGSSLTGLSTLVRPTMSGVKHSL